MNIEKTTEIFNSEDFVKKMEEVPTPEELTEFMNTQGADITKDELCEISKIFAERSSGEITEDELENVSGGGAMGKVAGAIWKGLKTGWNLGNKFADWEKNFYKKHGWNW